MKEKLEIQNVAVVLVETPEIDVEIYLAELDELVRTANGIVVQTFTQKRDSIDISTVVGAGKLDEIKSEIDNYDGNIDVVIFANRLSAVQRRNVSKVLDRLVIDKTDLILDIFALHATSAEGKKQVELAQLSYSLATKSEQDFSRQGGGIGTRGPGETQLETDKRLAREKIHRLRREIAELSAKRDVLRAPRKERNVFTVALVGYTNAGKSTLFNLITDNNVYADNKLFATLDTTVRNVRLPIGVDVLFTDTVGFIRDLPTELIEAFKSTLVETVDADLILNVCDVSDKYVNDHIEVTERLLMQLGVTAPIIRVFNKTDKEYVQPLESGRECVFVSALTGKNIDVLTEMICNKVMKNYTKLKLTVKVVDIGCMFALLKKYASNYTVDYVDDVANINVLVNNRFLHLFLPYLA